MEKGKLGLVLWEAREDVEPGSCHRLARAVGVDVHLVPMVFARKPKNEVNMPTLPSIVFKFTIN